MPDQPNVAICKHLRHAPQELEQLIVDHQQVAYRMANSMLRRWGVYLDRDEMISACHLALCDAAKHFNPDHGARFASFLYLYVKGELTSIIKEAVVRCRNTEFKRIHNDDDADRAQVGTWDPTPLHEARLSCADAIKSLNELEQVVVVEVLLNGYTVSEVARRLKYSRGHISEIKTAATKKLRIVMS